MHFLASGLNIFPKIILIFLTKKTCSERFSYIFSKKAFLISRKRNFLIFQERYIQNPIIFRTRSIFRTLAYSEPKAYLEHCKPSTMESFTRSSYLTNFPRSPQKPCYVLGKYYISRNGASLPNILSNFRKKITELEM